MIEGRKKTGMLCCVGVVLCWRCCWCVVGVVGGVVGVVGVVSLPMGGAPGMELRIAGNAKSTVTAPVTNAAASTFFIPK